jgi:hypothetical protein
MSLPLLSRSRFDTLLSLVRPPSCNWHDALIASERFALSETQVTQLQDAIWMVYRHYTGTMTKEDKSLIGGQQRQQFNEYTEKITYKSY